MFEPCICDGCHDILIMTFELKNIAILNVKGVDCRCVFWNMTRNDAVNMLGKDDKGT